MQSFRTGWEPRERSSRSYSSLQSPSAPKTSTDTRISEGSMTVTDLTTIEATGASFDIDRLMAVRARTRKAVHMIAEQLTPGLSEDQAKVIARNTLSGLGMRRGWHHIIVRCGSNTTKDFMERSDPGVVLKEDDIFFVDIGPVYGDYEGDAGDTFVFGGDP